MVASGGRLVGGCPSLSADLSALLLLPLPGLQEEDREEEKHGGDGSAELDYCRGGRGKWVRGAVFGMLVQATGDLSLHNFSFQPCG